MKFIRLGDTHLGVKQGSDVMLDFQIGYLRNLLKYCTQNNIGRIYQLGDLFDVRKYVYVNAFTKLHDLVSEYPDIEWVWAPGNHDQTTKNDLSLSAGYMLAKTCPNFTAHRKFHTETIDGKKITIVPWLCEENETDWEKLKCEGTDLIMGHFDIASFPFYQGVESTHGLPMEDFKMFGQVASGHFHTRSKRGNIEYLGSPYHLTWADYKDGTNRGFDVFDTDTMTAQKVDNDVSQSIFTSIDYRDGFGDTSVLKNKIVSVNIHDKTNASTYHDFIKQVDNLSLSFKTNDLTLKEMVTTKEQEKLVEFDRLTQILKFVDSQDQEAVSGLPEIMKDLYNKATSDDETF